MRVTPSKWEVSSNICNGMPIIRLLFDCNWQSKQLNIYFLFFYDYYSIEFGNQQMRLISYCTPGYYNNSLWQNKCTYIWKLGLRFSFSTVAITVVLQKESWHFLSKKNKKKTNKQTKINASSLNWGDLKTVKTAEVYLKSQICDIMIAVKVKIIGSFQNI